MTMTCTNSNLPMVDRCICRDVSFETLRDFAASQETDDHEMLLRAIRLSYQCGSGCGLCVPYIRTMLQTGKTRLPVQLPAEDRD